MNRLECISQLQDAVEDESLPDQTRALCKSAAQLLQQSTGWFAAGVRTGGVYWPTEKALNQKPEPNAVPATEKETAFVKEILGRLREPV